MNKLPRASVKKLPKMFRGAAVMRGRGFAMGALEKLIETRALDQFDEQRETFLVLDNRVLELEGRGELQCFADKAEAVRYAMARANGNVDQRVLCVRGRGQILVVATANEL